ncbi:MAG: glycosyltransferase family 2 protein, partial [Bacteroidaceae bacterium]|nr:glycosyltransferase family 2 protein [Bacteroidaceae bacterium]
MPKISAIIPVYNVEKYLDKCIESVINQTLKDIEIILVDDDSPDNCPQMCDQYAKNDNRIKVIHKNNEGFGIGRNIGIE